MTASLLSQRPAAAGLPADRATPRRVLMLTHRLPYPPDRGDRIRSFHLIKTLARHFELAVACTSDEPVWLQHHQLLMTMAKRVTIQPISAWFSKVRAVGALARGRPATPAYHYRAGLAEAITQWHEQAPFDVVLTFCTGMLHYARLLTGPRARPPRPRHILDLVDVDSLKWASYARQSPPPMRWVYAAEAARLRRLEAGLDDPFDAVTVISPAEAQAYREHVGGQRRLAVVGNGVDTEYFFAQPEAEPGNANLVFVGVLNYRPNAEGIEWFVQHVLPPLRQALPQVKLRIVGRHPTPAVAQLGRHAGVEVVGSVPDVRTYLAEAAVAVAPLQIARGVQNKVLEAMSSRRAVVCSTGAAAGIDARDGEHLLVASDPRQWVEHLRRLLTDSPARLALARAARRRVEERYSWEAALAPMVELIRGV